jgi:hypothetical protein
LIAFTAIKYTKGTREEGLATILESDLIIKRAYEELDRYAWSPEEIRTYDSIDMKQSVNVDLSWQEVFKTEDKQEIEKYCLEKFLFFYYLIVLININLYESKTLRKRKCESFILKSIIALFFILEHA